MVQVLFWRACPVLWVSIIHIRSFKNWLHCNPLLTKLVHLNLTSDSFKMRCSQQTLYILQNLARSKITSVHMCIMGAAIIFILTFNMPLLENMCMKIFLRLIVTCAAKIFAKQNSIEWYDIFNNKIGSTGVLSREHMVRVVVPGLDKAIISMHFT